MARIAFIPYPETGHLNPTFKLAKSLKARGHQVCYLGLPDFEDAIRSEGLCFLPIFERLCPKGFLRGQAMMKGVQNLDALMHEARRHGSAFAPDEEIERAARCARPDLLIVDLLLPQVARIARRMQVPAILLNIILFNPWEEVQPIFDSIKEMPEIILCPEEFEFPRLRGKKNCHYIEASIDLERKEAPFDWDRIDGSGQIIFCALGTQSHLVGESRQTLQTIIDAVAIEQGWQLVLSTGSHLAPESFGALPSNVCLVERAPQLEILKRASLMLTHGGINSVKECIFFGVPMIVFPMNRDQPGVAARVVYHGLGVRGSKLDFSPQQIHSLIRRVMTNTRIREQVNALGEKFREIETSGRGIQTVEAILMRSGVM